MYKYQIYIHICIYDMLWPGWAGSGLGSGQWVVVMARPGVPYGCASNASCSLKTKNGNKIHTYVCKNIYTIDMLRPSWAGSGVGSGLTVGPPDGQGAKCIYVFDMLWPGWAGSGVGSGQFCGYVRPGGFTIRLQKQ